MVDPRSRGEDPVGCGSVVKTGGRSPLTRGRPVLAALAAITARSIPAHAGKTSSASIFTSCGKVDPRSRGEDRDVFAYALRQQGRSPLTRGRRVAQPLSESVQGSIPAHAGKTETPDRGVSLLRVDPRSRGEDPPAGFGSTTVRGRSPLTRGRQERVDGAVKDFGSIPAHAGKTGREVVTQGHAEVDPRSRGEDSSRSARTSCCGGRSPLTRGRRYARTGGTDRKGSIPAHAGKTGFLSLMWGMTEGRSPLTRGRRSRRGDARSSSRSIPAHAGKTDASMARTACLQVDPRSRGEDSVRPAEVIAAAGRSPLTRGRHAAGANRDRAPGSIPAHAGKTCSS